MSRNHEGALCPSLGIVLRHNAARETPQTESQDIFVTSIFFDIFEKGAFTSNLARDESSRNKPALPLESCSLAGKNNMRFLLALMSAVALVCSPLLWGFTIKSMPRTAMLRKNTGRQAEYNNVRVGTKYPNESAAICCILKDDEAYIDEWVDFNYYVTGFEAFYIYDNSDEFFLEQWAGERKEKEGPAITVKHYNGTNKQASSYLDCAKNFGAKHTWVAFFDADEFLVFRGDHQDTHVVDFLHDNFDNNVGQVGFNWLEYGTAGRQTYEPRPVLKRFQYREENSDRNRHVKSIVRMKAYNMTAEKSHPHFQQILDTYNFVSASGTPMEDAFNVPPQVEKASLHHYYYKSAKEYALKTVRGRADLANETKTNFTEAMKYSTTKGNIFDDIAWKLLKSHVPKYELFDGPLQ